MQFDILKSGIENILALLNADNGQALTLEQVGLTSPSVYVDGAGVNPRNTEITVSALSGSGFSGSQTLRYTRVDLASKAVEAVEVQLTAESTLETIKAQLVADLGVRDDEVALSDIEMPAFEAGQAVIALQAVEGSYGYIGSVSVTLKEFVPAPVEVELAEVLTVTDFNGFTA